MAFQITEQILIIGIGGVGSKLETEAKNHLDADCFLISNDKNDLKSDSNTLEVSTGPIINPSIHLIRGAAGKSKSEIKKQDKLVVLDIS